ncbi:hypothetical protein D3C78_1883930 [compost metagenome]
MLGERGVGHVVLNELAQAVRKHVPDQPEHPQRNHDWCPEFAPRRGEAVDQYALPLMNAAKGCLFTGLARQ